MSVCVCLHVDHVYSIYSIFVFEFARIKYHNLSMKLLKTARIRAYGATDVRVTDLVTDPNRNGSRVALLI